MSGAAPMWQTARKAAAGAKPFNGQLEDPVHESPGSALQREQGSHMDQDLPSHRTPLDGTTWSVWREVALRSAGFPADMVLAICDEALARSADAHRPASAG